jgi:hypothetical protein
MHSRLVRALFFTIVATFFFAGSAHAATLFLSAPYAKVPVGGTFQVSVLVNTDGTAINTSDAIVNFPIDLLEAVSVSSAPSIFSLWVEQPTFSNIDGTFSFNGGVPNPGFMGQGGVIEVITFKSKKAGVATFSFQNAEVLANDGLGTNVLTAKSPLSIEIAQAPATVFPAVPVVASLTHPDQSVWYRSALASFNWDAPYGVMSIQASLTKESDATPVNVYGGWKSQSTVDSPADGVSYFNLRYMNALGWGPIAHYKIQVDRTAPPAFSVPVRIKGVQNIATLAAVDPLSGIDRYSIKIDESPAFTVKKASLLDSRYVLPTQNQGQHSLSVTVFDGAGNSTKWNGFFMSPQIVAPKLSVYPDQIRSGGTFTIRGQTRYPQATIQIFVQNEKNGLKTYTTKTAENGSYSIVSERTLAAGLVNIWSRLVFSDSIKSAPSDTATLRVNDGAIVQASKSFTYTLTFVIPALISLISLLLVLYITWHSFFGIKRRIHKETQAAMHSVHRTLHEFKAELHRQLLHLESMKKGRVLNEKEEKIFKDLQDNIDHIDKLIEKRIGKIK